MIKELLYKLFKERGQEGDRANSDKINSTKIVAIMAKPQLLAIFCCFLCPRTFFVLTTVWHFGRNYSVSALPLRCLRAIGTLSHS